MGFDSNASMSMPAIQSSQTYQPMAMNSVNLVDSASSSFFVKKNLLQRRGLNKGLTLNNLDGTQAKDVKNTPILASNSLSIVKKSLLERRK